MGRVLLDVEFEGIDSGDHEAQCWDVDRETFKRLEGHDPDEPDEGAGDFIPSGDRSYFHPGLFRHYVSYAPIWGKGKRVKVKIVVEEIEGQEIDTVDQWRAVRMLDLIDGFEIPVPNDVRERLSHKQLLTEKQILGLLEEEARDRYLTVEQMFAIMNDPVLEMPQPEFGTIGPWLLEDMLLRVREINSSTKEQ